LEILLKIKVSSVAHTLCKLQKKLRSSIESLIHYITINLDDNYKAPNGLVSPVETPPTQPNSSPSPVIERHNNACHPEPEKEHTFYPTKSGWLKVASRVRLSPKLTWKHRFFHLENGWLSFYKNEDMKMEDCYGFVKIIGCKVYAKHNYWMQNEASDYRDKSQTSSHKILIQHPNGKNIFHKRGKHRDRCGEIILEMNVSFVAHNY
jgi:hypothetical protein